MGKSFNIELQNGYNLCVEQNKDPNFPNEVYIGVTDRRGAWIQDLAVVRFGRDGMTLKENADSFEVLVYSDADDEDYTHRFHINLYKDSNMR